MTAVKTEESVFAALFSALQVPKNGSAWLSGIRSAGWERFQSLGIPSVDQEAWRYTSFRPLLRTAFRPSPSVELGTLPPSLPGVDTMVFLNGIYIESVSTCPAGVFPLQQQQERLEPFLRRPSDNPFVALNQAFAKDGVAVLLPAGQSLERPLHLLFVQQPGADPITVHPRIVVALGEGSRATLIESYVGTGVSFTNPVLQADLERGAVLAHCKLQQESLSSFHVGAIEVRQAGQSSFTSTMVSLGGSLVRQDTSTLFQGRGADCRFNGLSLLDGTQHVDHSTFIDHAVPECQSHELYKTMLDGRATAGFTGRIQVRQDAQKTDAHQTNKTLLLSPDATINTRPQLQIYADDVKCTHGAAVGQLDDAALFYLLSRGLGRDQARGLLTYAFASEVVDALPMLRDELRAVLWQRLALGPVEEAL